MACFSPNMLFQNKRKKLSRAVHRELALLFDRENFSIIFADMSQEEIQQIKHKVYSIYKLGSCLILSAGSRRNRNAEITAR